MNHRQLRWVTLAAWLLAGWLGAQTSTITPTGAATKTGFDPWWDSPALGLGPLSHASGSPTSVFRLNQPAAAPATLRKGQWAVGSQVDWANFFCDGGDRYLLDYESLRLRLGVAYGITAQTQVSLGTSVSYQGGGALDGFIEWFERSVGASNHDRLRAPRNRFLLRMRLADGTTAETTGQDTGWRFDNVLIEARHQLLKGSERDPAVAASFTVKVPVGTSIPGRPAGSVDVGASLSAAQHLGHFHLYGAVSFASFGSDEVQGVDLLYTQLSAMGAIEYRTTARTSYLLQLQVSGPVARHMGELSERTRDVVIGFKHRVGRDLLLEASVGENVVLFSNSADVSFHGGLVWRH